MLGREVGANPPMLMNKPDNPPPPNRLLSFPLVTLEIKAKMVPRFEYAYGLNYVRIVKISWKK